MDKISLAKILPDPLNPRERIDWEHSEDLAGRFQNQGFLPVGAVTVIERDLEDWWKDYEVSQRRHDARWKESVSINLVPRRGKVLQIVAGEHRYHGAIMAALPEVLGHRFTGTLEEARIMQAAENTGKAWTEKELLIMVKKAVDAGQSFDQIKRFTGKRANWIEARIEVSVLPLQVLESIGSYASVGAMKALAGLYALVGKSALFPDRDKVDLVIRDIVTRWEEKERPAGWLEEQARQWEQDSQQSFMFGSPVPNVRDLEEKEFGNLLSRYRRNVIDLTDALQTYLHGWKTSNPDASMADFVHAAASRKHTRVGQLLDSFRVADVQTRKLITLLCVEGDEEAACKLLKAVETCDAAPGTCTAVEAPKPLAELPAITEGEAPHEAARKIMAAILEAWKKGDLVEAIKELWLKTDAGKPSNNWSRLNRLMMILFGGTLDARGVMQWFKVKRVVKTGARPIPILAPWRPEDGHKVGPGHPPTAYYTIPVYAYHDTIGEPLQMKARDEAKEYGLPPLRSVASKIGVKVRHVAPAASEEAGGYYARGANVIVLHQKQWGVYFHELSHAVDDYLGQMPKNVSLKNKEGSINYARGEIVAETSAACLMALYGAQPEKGSFNYVKHFAALEHDGDPVSAVQSLLSRVLNVVTFILTCGSNPGSECPPEIIRKLDQKERKTKAAATCQKRKAEGKSCRIGKKAVDACPPSAKRLTIEIGNETLTDVCVTRIAPGKDFANYEAEIKGDLYAVNFSAARGSVTINESRTVTSIQDAQGRKWPGKWKFVRGGNGHYALVKQV